MYRWSVNEHRKFLDCGFASIFDGSVLKCTSRPSSTDAALASRIQGAEKGASSGRKRRNTRQPTSLAAVVSDTPAGLASPSVAGAGGREEGGVEGWRGREGCGEPRSDDEPSQGAALLPDSQLLLPSVPARPLHSHHHVLYRFDGSFLIRRMLCPVPM